MRYILTYSLKVQFLESVLRKVMFMTLMRAVYTYLLTQGTISGKFFEKSNVYDPYACGIYLLTQGTISGNCFEKSNVYDPYACGIYLLTQGTISGKCLVGHIIREISRFTKYFLVYAFAYCKCQQSFHNHHYCKAGLKYQLNL